LLDIWPSFSNFANRDTSWLVTLITAPLGANACVIHPSLSSLIPCFFSPYPSPTPLSGLLTLHIRRGDFIGHCLNLANWTSRYLAYNKFPGLPDRFSPSPLRSDGQMPEGPVRYHAHCFSDMEQIISRMREVRASLLSTMRLKIDSPVTASGRKNRVTPPIYTTSSSASMRSTA